MLHFEPKGFQTQKSDYTRKLKIESKKQKLSKKINLKHLRDNYSNKKLEILE